MKKIRAICAALTLLIMLSFSAMGGHIHTDAVPTPTPTPTPEFAASERDSESETDTLLAEITVSILQLLSVF